MRRFLKAIYEWFHKEPPKTPDLTEKFDQNIKELRAENVRLAAAVNRLEPADVLRSLVISMNSSKNR